LGKGFEVTDSAATDSAVTVEIMTPAIAGARKLILQCWRSFSIGLKLLRK